MREFSERDPQFILATCIAADELMMHGKRPPQPRDIDGSLMQLSHLRAAAMGWREAQMLFRTAYSGRKPRDARHDATLCGRYAKEADSSAKILSAAISLPMGLTDQHQGTVRAFWLAYRNVFVEVNSSRTCWLLIAMAGAEMIGVPQLPIRSELENERFDLDHELMQYARMAFEASVGLVNDFRRAMFKTALN